MLFIAAVLVAFPVALIKYSKKQLKGEMTYSRSHVKVLSIIMGKSKWQQHKAAGHITSTIKKKGRN